jgi:hypothetical protein
MVSPPIVNKVHMGDSIPGYGASMLSHDNLELSRYGTEECGVHGEHAVHTLNVG